MTRDGKHGLRCRLLALIRAQPLDPVSCAKCVGEPVLAICDLLIDMEFEGLIESARHPGRYAIAGAGM